MSTALNSKELRLTDAGTEVERLISPANGPRRPGKTLFTFITDHTDAQAAARNRGAACRIESLWSKPLKTG
jgi:hypothetical protein